MKKIAVILLLIICGNSAYSAIYELQLNKNKKQPIPGLNIISPYLVSSSNYILQGSISPKLSINNAYYQLNNGEAMPLLISEGAFLVNLTLQPGNNLVTLSITDLAKKKYSADVPLTYETGQPSSLELIEQAVKDGVISNETATIYKVYLVFGDPRLPESYKGDDSLANYSALLSEIDYSSLSPQAQQIINPFLLPPFYKESWFNQSDTTTTNNTIVKAKYTKKNEVLLYYDCINDPSKCEFDSHWDSITSDKKYIKVWFEKSKGESELKKAESLLNFLEGTAWPKLTMIIDKTPLSDGEFGGGPELDVCLVDQPFDANNKPVPGITISTDIGAFFGKAISVIYL